MLPPPTTTSGNRRHRSHGTRSHSASAPTANDSTSHSSSVGSSNQLPYVTLVSVLVAIVLASTRIPTTQAFAPSSTGMHPARIRSSLSPLQTDHTVTTKTRRPTLLQMSPQKDSDSSLSPLVEATGLIAQPVVWISLYTVGTTGAGLPAGPLGLIGALEGVSYLVMVGLAGSVLFNSKKASLAQNLSVGTITLGLLVLVKLAADQGCVPNAKPLLDYSAYVNVCNPEDGTPGLFGG